MAAYNMRLDAIGRKMWFLNGKRVAATNVPVEIREGLTPSATPSVASATPSIVSTTPSVASAASGELGLLAQLPRDLQREMFKYYDPDEVRELCEMFPEFGCSEIPPVTPVRSAWTSGQEDVNPSQIRCRKDSRGFRQFYYKTTLVPRENIPREIRMRIPC